MKSYRQPLIISWFSWHFFEMPVFLVEVWKNYLSFGAYYFSIPLLLKTLLSPWRQYRWKYPRGFDIPGYFATFISNMFSRLIGMVARIILIIVGLLAQLFILLLGFLGIVLWLAAPCILALLIWWLL